MKTKFLIIALIFSFVGSIAQQKEGAKFQKEDESGFIEVDKAPALISQLKPVYPELAKLSGIEGTVYLKLLIDEKGNVVKAKVEQGAKDMLDEAALTAAKEAKFSPAMVQNKPVKVWVVLPIAFKLDVNKKEEARILKYNELEPQPSNIKGEEPKIVSPGIKAPTNIKEPGINEMVEVEKFPELIEAPKPEYPETAKRAGITGKVFVKILIDIEGTPKKAVVIKSDSELFNQSAVDAAMKSKFTPAINQGKAIAVWIVLPYKFSLGGTEKGESELFDNEKMAKESYENFISLFDASPEVQKAIMGTPNRNIKSEKVNSNISFGDESSIYKLTSGDITKYNFIARLGNKIYKYWGVKSLEEIQNYVDDLKKKEKMLR